MSIPTRTCFTRINSDGKMANSSIVFWPKKQKDPHYSSVTKITENLLQGRWMGRIFTRAQYVESKLLLANYLLSSQRDRMGMANSVEGRYPFLDHRVVEFATRIPVRLKMKGLNEKYLLKKAMQGLLPAAIVERKKQPYMAPDILSFLEQPYHHTLTICSRRTA